MEWRRISRYHIYLTSQVPCAHVWPKKLLSFSSEAAVAVANKKQKNLPRRHCACGTLTCRSADLI